jgi:nucleotide-binding universal stress UspA family protein
MIKDMMGWLDGRKADRVVMGGYGPRRLCEWLLSGVTYKTLHEAPVPLLMAH